MNNILEVRNLSRAFRSQWTFKRKTGIQDISFAVAPGESFALLGANGAGKTTTIKNILGFLVPDSGEVFFEGERLETPRQRAAIGFLPEQPYFYQYLTVEETLSFYAALFSMNGSERRERVAYVMDRLSIGHKSKEKVKSLSKGQQQRVGLAQVLLNDPSLLILDEPFSGLDPLARVEIRNLLLELKAQGKSMIVSSHILSDIELLCDRAVILKQGKMREETNISQLLNIDAASYKVSVQVSSGDLAEIENAAFPEEIASGITTSREVSGAVVFEFPGYDEARRFVSYCFDKQYTVLEFSRIHTSLEDVFISANAPDEVI
jgi:ABC-2 type transport system ATP-binding protein